MSDSTTHLLLPYILAAQAQKHVTHNEALRLLDAMVQLAVIDRTRTAPPASPADGDRHIVASGASGLWQGWDNAVAYWIDGAWTRLSPRPGWLGWVAAEGVFVSWTGAAWQPLGASGSLTDASFSVASAGDPTKRAFLDLSGLSAGSTRTYRLPDTSSEIAILAGTQTFTGAKTFSGTLTASGAAAAIGTATGTAAYGIGTGATATGATKTVNLGTGGAAGSTTVVNIGSDAAGAGGSTVVNTPTVTFANTVAEVGMPQANLTAQRLGLGGATADGHNRLSANTPAVLFNHAGAGVEATVNKAAPADDASLAFKTGFGARALVGLLGSDDFSVKVSPDGAGYLEALRIGRTSGQVEIAEPVLLPGRTAPPDPPPAGRIHLYARTRAGSAWLEVMRPSGRTFPLQPHFGVNRIAYWAPSAGSTVNTIGMPRTAVGTTTTPGISTAGLATSIRRWRVASAATADAVAEERSQSWVCWRGNAEGLGGFTYVNRVTLDTLRPTGMGFFGLIGSTAALAPTLTLASVVNAIGIGFQRGTHANWQIVHNSGSGAPTLINLGGSFPVDSTSNVLTLFLHAAPNAGSVWVRVVEEVAGTVAEVAITANLPTLTQLLSPRNYMNSGSTAASVAFDCSGLYVETDY
jgi:hypothetical protein